MNIPIQAIDTTLHAITEGHNYDAESPAKLMNCLESPPYTMTIEVSNNYFIMYQPVFPLTLSALNLDRYRVSKCPLLEIKIENPG